MSEKVKDVMGLADVAEYLNMSKWTLYRKVAAGEIPSTKVGKRYKFLKVVIDEWLKDKMLQNYNGDSDNRTRTRQAELNANHLKRKMDALRDA